MNLKQPYEQVIAKKLEQELPIPDMADAIWTRIAQQLDASIEAEHSTETAIELPPVQQAIVKTSTIVVGGILSLIVLFFIIKKSVKNKENNHQKPRIEQHKNPAVKPELQDSLGKDTLHLMPATPNDTKLNNDPLPMDADIILVPKKDDPLHLLIPNAAIDSSLQTIIPSSIKSSTDSMAPIPPIKKPRGVPLDNDAYKIESGKKDSTKNGN